MKCVHYVFNRDDNEEYSSMTLHQNRYLAGKLSQIIHLPEGYAIEYPWFVIEYNPCLVIYQVMNNTKSDGNRNYIPIMN